MIFLEKDCWMHKLPIEKGGYGSGRKLEGKDKLKLLNKIKGSYEFCS